MKNNQKLSKMRTFQFAVISIITLLVFSSCNKVNESNNLESNETKKAEAHLDLKSSSAHWGYDGEEGPEHWGELSPEYILCAEGLSQSPINLNHKDIPCGELSEIEFFYTECGVLLENNGHSVMGTPAEDNYIELEGVRYDLLQFHFHAPSEHSVNNILLPIEAHFVHVNSEGKLLVIGVFIKAGCENDDYASMWDNLPDEDGETILIDEVDIVELLPQSKKVYHYSGSLTTPPCSEGVNWNVMIQKIPMSLEQISAFESIYDHNNRPVQEINGRQIVKRHEHE